MFIDRYRLRPDSPVCIRSSTHGERLSRIPRTSASNPTNSPLSNVLADCMNYKGLEKPTPLLVLDLVCFELGPYPVDRLINYDRP